MRKLFLLLAMALFFTLGCAGPQTAVPTLIETGTPQVLGLEVTLLPVLDSRRFLGPEEYPNPARRIPLLIPAAKIAAQGEKVMRRENLFMVLKPYAGPLPEGPAFRWTEFPLRGLKTDLGLGLELKLLSLRKAGRNALIIPHALLDAAALPLFAAGITATNGHTDLAARVIPSASAEFTMKVGVNFISLIGRGLVFSKTYQVSLTDPMVTESALFEGFFRSTEDGQALGRAEAPRVIEDVFGLMARDPELAYLPRYVRTSWLNRALADPRVKPELKVRLLKGLDRELMVPSFTPEEIKLLSEKKFFLAEKVDFVVNLERPTPVKVMGGDFLEAYALNPGWLEEARAQRNLFVWTYQVLRRALGHLGRQKMFRPLSEVEKALEERARALLGLWGRRYAANQLYRAALRDEKVDPAEKRVLALLLAQDLETYDNDEFIQAEIEAKALALSAGSPLPVPARQAGKVRAEAAAFLVALKGAQAVDEYPIGRETLLKVLSADDGWAGPLVIKALAAGDFNPEIIRLAGALRLTETLPRLLSVLEAEVFGVHVPAEVKSGPAIPLLPSEPKKKQENLRPNPVLIVRTLGCFHDCPEVLSALRSILSRVREEDAVEAGLAAEVILALGCLKDRETAPVIMDLWTKEWIRDAASSPVRRACLKALEDLAGPDVWAGILDAALARSKEPKINPAAMREVADFMGRTRYGRAVTWLGQIIRRPASTRTMRQAALRALSLIATREAEAELTALAGSVNQDLARSAARALDRMAVERAFWRTLERS